MSSSLIISVAVFAISLAALQNQLSYMLDAQTHFFFNLKLEEQIGFLGLIFSFIFLSTSIFVDVFGNSGKSFDVMMTKSTNRTKPLEYPIDEMKNVTTEKERFECIFPLLREELVEHMKSHQLGEEAYAWVDEMLDYTVPGGKLNRGTTVVNVYQLLNKTDDMIDIAKASVLGWTVEFLQAFFLVADDVMDDSVTRRGQPCWYKLPKVGMIAINDAFLLESFVFTILKKHFGQTAYYHQLVDLFLQVTQNTEFGQLLDLTSQPQGGTIDLSRFTWDRYRMIVKYKTAYYTFYLPVAIGMITSGVKERKSYELAEKICLKMGEYFQIQDDYLDCFGDPKHIGKVGTDIQDNKCSWLVVQALERSTPAQRATLSKNYGQWDDKKVERVKDLYKDLQLPTVFQQYEEESYKSIQKDLQHVKTMPKECFDILLKKIYKRSK